MWSELATIRDPEIPAINLVELGRHRLRSVDDASRRGRAAADVRGLPGHRRHAGADHRAVGALGLADEVSVRLSFDPPWTSDRITPEGRERLRLSGFAPPHIAPSPVGGMDALEELAVLSVAECPYCGSREHDAREPVRADAVPGDLPLRRLPPAVRAIQAHLSGRPDALPFEPW